jgi:hypothetical protein
MITMALYLISVLDDTTDSATGDEMAAIDAFNEQLRADGHWVFPAASRRPARPPSSTAVGRSRCSPTGLIWSRRSTSPVSGSWKPPTSTVRLDPSPIVRLNRAIAIAELDGPAVALAEVEGLPLEGYHAFHATRADLLRRLGRSEESRAAYDRAIGLAGNTAETAYLIRRRDQLATP